jgi:quinoprotein glucose dehydrogenase
VQADRGKAVYAANCAMCHGESLNGIDVAPPLVGSAFLNNWNSTSAGDLFTRIHDTMPLNNPGTLGGRSVADVEAFMLQANGFPAGSVDLPSNPAMLAGTKILSSKPGS